MTEGELDYLLEATKKDPELLSKLKNYGLISVISEKDDKVVSIFTNISDFVQKRWVGNGLTAAATVLLTVMIINNPFDSRFSESEFINSQIRDAIESEEASSLSIASLIWELINSDSENLESKGLFIIITVRRTVAAAVSPLPTHLF